MAAKIIARVQRTGVSERVRKEMNAYDRRMVHMEAAEAAGVATRSIGDGSYKQIEFYATDADGNETFPAEE
jgi:predicted RNA-binding protein Jag